jgi:hypothetical protein
MVSTQQVQNLSSQQAKTNLSTKNSLHQQAKQTPQLMCHQNPVYEHEDLEKNLSVQ